MRNAEQKSGRRGAKTVLGLPRISHRIAAAVLLAALLHPVNALAQTNAPTPRARAEALYEEVKGAIAEQRFPDAQRLIDQMVTIDPSFPEGHRANAYVHYELGHYAEAEEALETFRRLVPTDRHNILILLGRIQMARKKYREAADTLERVVRLQPRAEGIYTSLGRLYYYLEDYDLAIERLETARLRDPARFQDEATDLLKSAYAHRIDALIAANRLNEAVTCLDRILALAPPMAVAFLKRGAVLSGLGTDLSQAERDVIQYIGDHPGAARAYLLLGNIRQQIGRPKQAIECYERAIELDPAIPGVRAVLGALCYQAHDYAKAVEHLRRATALAPDDAVVRYNLGLACLRTEAFDEAKECMQAVIKVSPTAPGPYLILAQVALYEGRIEEALAQLEQWATRVRRRSDLDTVDKERIFETLYNNSQYRALIRNLRARL